MILSKAESSYQQRDVTYYTQVYMPRWLTPPCMSALNCSWESRYRRIYSMEKGFSSVMAMSWALETAFLICKKSVSIEEAILWQKNVKTKIKRTCRPFNAFRL